MILREERLLTYSELDQLESSIQQLQKTMENMRNMNIKAMQQSGEISRAGLTGFSDERFNQLKSEMQQLEQRVN